jgi:hypothetical protein
MGDLYGRHAVSVSKKTRQKVSNLAHSGQKVSNPTKFERGESVGRGAAPRPRSPDARSSAKLLRGSHKPSGTTGLQTAQRLEGHDRRHKTSDTVRKSVSMKVRWGNDGDGEHWDRKRVVKPEYDSQEEDHEALQVSKVRTTEQRHKGEEPGLVSPTNAATLPCWECQQQYPKPSWARGKNPTRQHLRSKPNKQGYYHLTHTNIWTWLVHYPTGPNAHSHSTATK